MTNTYRIRYQRDHLDLVTDRPATSPISALNLFHKEMQVALGLGPKDYKLVQLSLLYNANSHGTPEMVESAYDLPKADNPDLAAIYKITRQEETEAMEFLATTPVKEIS